MSRARRNVESAFGILSNKWKIFHKAINVNVDFAILLIKTCCALHNFVRSRDGYNIQDAMSIEGFIEMGQDTTGPSRAAIPTIQARNKLTNDFISDVGSVPWQSNYI